MVAVPAPGLIGLVISPPVVRDGEGRVFMVRDANAETPKPNLLITELELEERSALVRVPHTKARQHWVAIVPSPRFLVACDAVNPPTTLTWHPIVDGCFAYAEVGEIRAWLAETARCFLAHAQSLYHRWQQRGMSAVLEQAEEVLRNSLFLTDRGTELRGELLVTYGAVVEGLDLRRLPAIIDLASRDGIRREDFMRRLKAASRTAGSEETNIFGVSAVAQSMEPVAYMPLALATAS